jgi:hypothetical protein
MTVRHSIPCSGAGLCGGYGDVAYTLTHWHMFELATAHGSPVRLYSTPPCRRSTSGTGRCCWLLPPRLGWTGRQRRSTWMTLRCGQGAELEGAADGMPYMPSWEGLCICKSHRPMAWVPGLASSDWEVSVPPLVPCSTATMSGTVIPCVNHQGHSSGPAWFCCKPKSFPYEHDSHLAVPEQF